MIVENDPMVAEIERQYLKKDPRIDAISIRSDGQSAWEALQAEQTELLLLDVQIPRMDGFALLRRLRRRDLPTQVILITADGSWTSIGQALRLGVLDYLLKPFEYERFQAALGHYFNMEKLLTQTGGQARQQDVDRLFLSQEGGPLHKTAEKGIHPRTLELIRTFFQTHRGEGWACGQVAQQVGLSRVTVNKYLRYMELNHQLISRIDYATEGRPRISYFWNEEKISGAVG